MKATDFWKHVNKQAGNGCWLWTSCISWEGYGRAQIDGKQYQAHRYAWISMNGPIPRGQCVLHRCDVRSCVRHLYLGDRKQNAADCVARDRHTRGERTRVNKLTDAMALEILRQKPERRTMGLAKQLAAQHGVGPAAVHAIWRGEYWKHIRRELPQGER